MLRHIVVSCGTQTEAVLTQRQWFYGNDDDDDEDDFYTCKAYGLVFLNSEFETD